MATGQALKLLLLTATLTGTLAACVSAGKAEAPPGVRLDGPWQLDRSASDDPQKQIDKLREYVAKMVARRRPSSSLPPPGPGRGGRGMRGPRTADQDQDDQSVNPRESQSDILSNSSTMHELMDFLTRGDSLTVRQEPDDFVLVYNGSKRSFTPGAHSVVSSQRGVADQVSGWKGSSYVIDIRPQVGASITEEYSLSEDKQHLIVKLHVGSSELPAVDLKQVYARGAVGPRALPTND